MQVVYESWGWMLLSTCQSVLWHAAEPQTAPDQQSRPVHHISLPSVCDGVCVWANERQIVKRLGWKCHMNAAVYHFCYLNIIWYFCLPSRVLQGSSGSCWGLRANGPEAERQERVHCAGDPQTRSPQLWGHPVHSSFWAQVWSLHIWQYIAVRYVLWCVERG